MKPWEATVPQPLKQKDIKRCYTVWNLLLDRWKAGGKVVWLTDSQLTLARIKYPRKTFEPVLERDLLELYKKYLDQTID
jgi:hypothetical protein